MYIYRERYLIFVFIYIVYIYIYVAGTFRYYVTKPFCIAKSAKFKAHQLNIMNCMSTKEY